MLPLILSQLTGIEDTMVTGSVGLTINKEILLHLKICSNLNLPEMPLPLYFPAPWPKYISAHFTRTLSYSILLATTYLTILSILFDLLFMARMILLSCFSVVAISTAIVGHYYCALLTCSYHHCCYCHYCLHYYCISIILLTARYLNTLSFPGKSFY